ncbi:NAD(P)-binding domain-containing protein [Candidatus Micrarchaeota archaeon]|nr:NAD(P)-binding domain-containing protein [Candidatus Micrarchaeota archaeon]
MDVCVIGVGRLGSALLEGWKKSGFGLTAVSHHGVPDVVTQVTLEQAAKAEVVVISVKPKDVPEILEKLNSDWVVPGPLVVSVAVQPDLDALEAGLPNGAAVVRAMPNNACAVGKSVTAYALGKNVSEKIAKTLQSLWDACGLGIHVTENQMAAAIALSGCGPAYAFRFVKAMAEAGQKMGLNANTADSMARSVLQGANGLMERTPGKTAVEWINQVATPGGTTEAALKKWDDDGFDRVVAEGLKVAFEKNKTRGPK